MQVQIKRHSLFFQQMLKAFIACLVLLFGHMGFANSSEEQCTDEFRMTIATVKRIEDYLAIINPFLTVLGKAVDRQPETIFSDGWVAASEQLLTGRADLAIIPQSMVPRLHAGLNLLPLVKTPGAKIALFVGVDSSITSLEQLIGLRVAVIKDSTGELSAIKTLTDRQLVNQIDLVEATTPSEVSLGLLNGEFDAAIVAEIAVGQLRPVFKDRLKVIEYVGETQGLFIYLGPCFNDKERAVITEILLNYESERRVQDFLRYFNLGRFIPVDETIVMDSIEKANSLVIDQQ